MNLKKNRTNFIGKIALIAAITLQAASMQAGWFSVRWGSASEVVAQAAAPVATQTKSSFLPDGYVKTVAGYVFDRNVVGAVATMAALGIAYDIFLGHGKTQELIRTSTKSIKKAVKSSQEYLGNLISSEHTKTRETVEQRADRLEQQNKELGKKLDNQGVKIAAIARAVGADKEGPTLYERVMGYFSTSAQQ